MTTEYAKRAQSNQLNDEVAEYLASGGKATILDNRNEVVAVTDQIAIAAKPAKTKAKEPAPVRVTPADLIMKCLDDGIPRTLGQIMKGTGLDEMQTGGKSGLQKLIADGKVSYQSKLEHPVIYRKITNDTEPTAEPEPAKCSEADLKCSEADLKCSEADLKCSEADLKCSEVEDTVFEDRFSYQIPGIWSRNHVSTGSNDNIGRAWVGVHGTPATLAPAGRKDDEGKYQFSLLPAVALVLILKVLKHGAAKYDPDNWRHVEDGQTRYFDAAMRHLLAWRSGYQNDDESGLPHLAHAACCLIFLIALTDSDGGVA